MLGKWKDQDSEMGEQFWAEAYAVTQEKFCGHRQLI